MAAAEGNTKRCPKCERILTPSDFGKDKKRKDGLKCWCKICHNASSAEAYRRDPQTHISRSSAWRLRNLDKHRKSVRDCHARHKEKRKVSRLAWQRDNPERRREHSARYYEKNRASILERNRNWRSENSFKIREQKARYRAENRTMISALKRGYKARKKGAKGSHTAEDVMNILRMQRRRCAYCRNSLKSGFHVDHIVSLDQGGSNDPRNLQVTCRHCNLKKKNKDPIFFAQQMGLLI